MSLELTCLFLRDTTLNSTLFPKSSFCFAGEESLDCLVIRAFLVRHLVSLSSCGITLTSGSKTQACGSECLCLWFYFIKECDHLLPSPRNITGKVESKPFIEFPTGLRDLSARETPCILHAAVVNQRKSEGMGSALSICYGDQTRIC